MKGLRIVIYPLLKTQKGLCPAEFEVAEVSLSEGKTVIHCQDGALREKIKEIFASQIRVRRIKGDIPMLFSHSFTDVQPDTDDFFMEIIYQLRKYNLYGVLKTK